MPAGADPGAFVAANWLVIDGHWNQRGSDLFGDAIARYLKDSRQFSGR
jgi:hypothetical protein